MFLKIKFFFLIISLVKLFIQLASTIDFFVIDYCNKFPSWLQVGILLSSTVIRILLSNIDKIVILALVYYKFCILLHKSNFFLNNS